MLLHLSRIGFILLLGLVLVVANATEGSPPEESSPAAETKFLAIEGGRIAFDDSGGLGPLVVTVPGMGDLRSEYRFLRARLIRDGFRVVTVDVRGMGESTALWKDYSAHAVAKDLLVLLDVLHARDAAVIGTSFAAGAGLWLAHDAPERVSRLVLISPIVRNYPRTFFQDAVLDVGFAGPWRVQFWLGYWDSLFPSRTPPDQESVRSRLAANLREPGRMDALENMVRLSKSDTASLLSRQAIPTLLVVGSKDRDFKDPESEARHLSAALRAQLILIKGAGHYPQVEMPDETGDAIVGFLRIP